MDLTTFIKSKESEVWRQVVDEYKQVHYEGKTLNNPVVLQLTREYLRLVGINSWGTLAETISVECMLALIEEQDTIINGVGWN